MPPGSDPHPASGHDVALAAGRDHDVAAATSWFAAWGCYRAIVDHDWMRHAEITAAIRASLLATRQTPFSVLDLGCGDAEPGLRALAGTVASGYTGVDAAPAALVEARRRLAAAGREGSLVAADAVAEIARRAEQGERVDVILAGYVVHHFPAPLKRSFFQDCRRALARGGEFFFFDIHRLPGMSRDDYLAAYVKDMEAWQPLSAEAFALTCDHLRAFDFPETGEFILHAGADAGFAGADLLYADDDRRGFHRLYRFRNAAAETLGNGGESGAGASRA